MTITLTSNVTAGLGGLGWHAGLYEKQGLVERFGAEHLGDLCAACALMDTDQKTASLVLPGTTRMAAVAGSEGESFIAPPQKTQDLRRAGLRDPQMALIAERMPQTLEVDTATGAAKDVHIARNLIAASQREVQNLIDGRFAAVREADRIERLRDLGVRPDLASPTSLTVMLNGYGGTGNGWACDVAVIGGNTQRRLGFVNAKRRAIIGLPDCAGDEVQNRANFLAFIKTVALSWRYPGRYRAVGYGGRCVTLDEPLFHELWIVGHTNTRLVAPSRQNVAFRMAQISLNLMVGGVASMVHSVEQDARRHLAGIGDADQIGPRIIARGGVSAVRFDRAAMLDTAVDEIVTTLSRFLCLGNS